MVLCFVNCYPSSSRALLKCRGQQLNSLSLRWVTNFLVAPSLPDHNWYTPVRKVLEQKEVLWLCLGGNGSTRTILCQTCVVLGTVTDFRLTHRKYAKVIKAQSSHIKW